MVNIVDLRPARPGFNRRRKRRRQSEQGKGGASSESCSYWEGGDGTVVREDGTVETPVRPETGTELDFGGTEASIVSASASATLPGTGTGTGTNSNASSSPRLDLASSTITPSTKEVTPAEKDANAGASNHALDQESSSVPASPVASSATATVPAEALATVGSPANNLQHQVDFLEEQLQIRSTEIEWLQSDLQTTKAQLAAAAAATAAAANDTATATATATADAHEQAVIDMQEENIRQMQSLMDLYERALQERDARHARILEQQRQQQLSEHQQQHQQHQQQQLLLSEQRHQQQHAELEQNLATQREQLALQEDNELEIVQEWHQLQEKGVRDAQQASVRHVEEVQRYKDQLEGSDSKLLLAEEEIRLLKEQNRHDLELVDEKYTKELQEREQGHHRGRVQMETDKAEEIAALRASLRGEVNDDSSLQKALKASEERHKIDLARANETFHEVLRKRDARHQEQREELQLALKAQTDEIADLTTSMRQREFRIIVDITSAHVAGQQLNEQKMKEKYAEERRKRDECHRGELEKLQGVIKTKTSKIAAMKESLHSLKDTPKVDMETTGIDADRLIQRPLVHPATAQKPFGSSSQVLEVEAAEPVIAANALPKSPTVLKTQSPRIEAASTRKGARDPDDKERRRRSSPKNSPVASAPSRNGRDRSAESKQVRRSDGTPAPSFDYRSAFAANSANRSLYQKWQSPSPKGRDRSPDSKPRKRPGVKLIPGASITNPSSAASSSTVSHRTPPRRRRESVAKLGGAKKARIVIDSPGSDSDTVFSNNSV
jgi:hypothetical protein